MTAKLRLALDNQTRPGLRELQQDLRQSSAAADELAAELDPGEIAAYAREVEQLKVLELELALATARTAQAHEEAHGSLLRMGAATTELALVAARTAEAQEEANGSLLRMASTALQAAGTMKGLARGAGVATEAFAALRLGLAAAGAGMGTAATVTGVTAVTLLTLAAAVKGLGVVFDSTGIKMEVATDKAGRTQQGARALQEQFYQSGLSVQEFEKRMGKSLEEMGLESVSNLDSIKSAFATTWDQIVGRTQWAGGRLVEEGESAFRQLGGVFERWGKKVWKDFDKETTESTQGIVGQLRDLGNNWEQTQDFISESLAGMFGLSGDEAKQNLREVKDGIAAVQDMRKKAAQEAEAEKLIAPHKAEFETIEKQIEDIRKARARAEELASIKTLEEIDKRMEAEREAAQKRLDFATKFNDHDKVAGRLETLKSELGEKLRLEREAQTELDVIVNRKGGGGQADKAKEQRAAVEAAKEQRIAAETAVKEAEQSAAESVKESRQRLIEIETRRGEIIREIARNEEQAADEATRKKDEEQKRLAAEKKALEKQQKEEAERQAEEIDDLEIRDAQHASEQLLRAEQRQIEARKKIDIELLEARKGTARERLEIERKAAEEQIKIENRIVEEKEKADKAAADDAVGIKRAELERIQRERELDAEHAEKIRNLELDAARRQSEKVKAAQAKVSASLKDGGAGAAGANDAQHWRDVQVKAFQDAQAAAEEFQIAQLRAFAGEDVQGAIDNARRYAADQAKFAQIIMQAQQKLKEEQQGGSGIIGQIRGSFDDKKLIDQIAKTRTEKPLDELKARQKQERDDARKEGMDPDEYQRLKKQQAAEQEKLQRDIKRQTHRDAKGGKIDQGEITQAQTDLTNGVIDAAEANGSLSKDTIAALRQAAQAVAQNKQETIQLAGQVKAIQDALNEVMGGGNRGKAQRAGARP